jgi:hypothetical protein
VIPFIEALLQEPCQSALVAAFIGDIVAEKRKKDRGAENSAVLLLPKLLNKLNVISQQFDRGLFPEHPTPLQPYSPRGSP